MWCIDHLQGYVYTKVKDAFGVTYFEADDIRSSPPPSCRFFVGFDSSSSQYDIGVFDQDRLQCTLQELGGAVGIRHFELIVTKAQANGTLPSSHLPFS